MQYRVIDWNSPGSYDLFWGIIGAVLFGLLFADFIWIYYKLNRKDSESAPPPNKGLQPEEDPGAYLIRSVD
jgi:hypothetical protein